MRHPPRKSRANPAGRWRPPRTSAFRERTRTAPKAPRPSAALARPLPVASRRSRARRPPALNARSARRNAIWCRPPRSTRVHDAAPSLSARAQSAAPTPPTRPARLASRLDTTWTTVTSVGRANRAPTPPPTVAPPARAPRAAVPLRAPMRTTLHAVSATPAIFETLASRQRCASVARPFPVASRRSRARLPPIPNAHSARREAGCRDPYPVSVHHAARLPSPAAPQ
jgi:hypothetical protein